MASYGYTSNRSSAPNGNGDGGGRDHVFRPVLVDAQGRITPLGYLNTNNGLQGYVAKAAEGHGFDQPSDLLIRSAAAVADEDQDLFEKIRREVSRPKSWNNMLDRTAPTSQHLSSSLPGKYSLGGVGVAPPHYGGREMIDNEEVRRRYGRWGVVPPQKREYYGTTDSREVAKRYGGIRL